MCSKLVDADRFVLGARSRAACRVSAIVVD
jgi:hypothetical protein